MFNSSKKLGILILIFIFALQVFPLVSEGRKIRSTSQPSIFSQIKELYKSVREGPMRAFGVKMVEQKNLLEKIDNTVSEDRKELIASFLLDKIKTGENKERNIAVHGLETLFPSLNSEYSLDTIDSLLKHYNINKSDTNNDFRVGEKRKNLGMITDLVSQLNSEGLKKLQEDKNWLLNDIAFFCVDAHFLKSDLDNLSKILEYLKPEDRGQYVKKVLREYTISRDSDMEVIDGGRIPNHKEMTFDAVADLIIDNLPLLSSHTIENTIYDYMWKFAQSQEGNSPIVDPLEWLKSQNEVDSEISKKVIPELLPYIENPEKKRNLKFLLKTLKD